MLYPSFTQDHGYPLHDLALSLNPCQDHGKIKTRSWQGLLVTFYGSWQEYHGFEHWVFTFTSDPGLTCHIVQLMFPYLVVINNMTFIEKV